MLDIFTEKQWQQVKDDYEGWWKQTREKPILHLSFVEECKTMKRPEGMITENLFHYPESESPESIAEKMEYIMRSRRYEYNGYPYIWVYFGPVSTVEYIGCKPHIGPSTVWFSPRDEIEPSKRHITRDPRSEFLPRNHAIRKAIQDRFGGGYVVSGPCGAGCNLDYVAEFYGHEELSYMLYDEPDEVKRLMDEIQAALLPIGDEEEKLTPGAVGYTAWGGIFAPKPWVTMQCDYCAMIGRKHFEEFEKPELVEHCKRSPEYNYYHLDGPGEIIHMDSILDIPELKCMQWVTAPNGELDLDLKVYSNIFNHGKNMWVTGPIEKARAVAEKNGTAKGIFWTGTYDMKDYDRIMKIAEELMQ